MRIRLFVTAIALLLLAGLSVAQDKYKSHKSWSHGANVTTNDDGPPDDCTTRLRMWSDDYDETQRAEELRTFPNQPMKVTASRNGGIQVRTWDKPEISVKVCKAAAAHSAAQARAILEQVKLIASGNTLTVAGPDRGGNQDDDFTWSSLVIIQAPAGATFDLSAHNGGISARQFTGNLTAETTNGGISLSQSSGKLDVHAQNGGISIKDCGGDVRANVQNGGLHIELAETWNGRGLDANTRNGGLVVAVPKSMQSGVEVALKGHGGVVCQSDVCSAGQRTWDDDGRTIHFGSGNVVVRASTVNGGLVIQERGRKRARL